MYALSSQILEMFHRFAYTNKLLQWCLSVDTTLISIIILEENVKTFHKVLKSITLPL